MQQLTHLACKASICCDSSSFDQETDQQSATFQGHCKMSCFLTGFSFFRWIRRPVCTISRNSDWGYWWTPALRIVSAKDTACGCGIRISRSSSIVVLRETLHLGMRALVPHHPVGPAVGHQEAAWDFTWRKARPQNHHGSGAAVMESALRSSYPFCLQRSG